jgi:hypothetical protein
VIHTTSSVRHWARDRSSGRFTVEIFAHPTRTFASCAGRCDGERVNFGSIPPEVLGLVAALAVAIAVIQALVLAVRRWARRRRMSLRMERAVAGEERAAGLLEREGYSVLGAQAVVEHPVRIDDRLVRIALRADYLAERGGRRYVVEVKTGSLAPKIETSATRRQMLEYRLAFDVDGVLLVDAESGTVHEVTFPTLDRFGGTSRGASGWRVVVIAAVAVAAAVFVFVRSM